MQGDSLRFGRLAPPRFCFLSFPAVLTDRASGVKSDMFVLISVEVIVESGVERRGKMKIQVTQSFVNNYKGQAGAGAESGCVMLHIRCISVCYRTLTFPVPFYGRCLRAGK